MGIICCVFKNYGINISDRSRKNKEEIEKIIFDINFDIN